MNPVVHWELFAEEPETLGAFYAELFGWAVQPLPEVEIGYVLIDTRAGGGICGGIAGASDGQRPPIFYAATDDLQGTLQRAEDAGGAVTLPPITEVVNFAQFADPEGHTVGLVQRGDESVVSPGNAPPVSRFHMSSIDPPALADFYQSVFSWRVQRRRAPHDEVAFEVETGAGGIGGTIACPVSEQPPLTFYARVAEAEVYLQRARELGAVGDGRWRSGSSSGGPAYFTDPSGNMFGLTLHQVR